MEAKGPHILAKPVIAINPCEEIERWIMESPEPKKRGCLCIFYDYNSGVKFNSQVSIWHGEEYADGTTTFMDDVFKTHPMLADAARNVLEQLDKEI